MLERLWVVGPFQCNCRLLACARTGEAALIDPGDEGPRLARELADLRLPDGRPVVVRHLLHTHAHLDHFGGTRALVEALPAGASPSLGVHREDVPLWRMLREQGRLFGLEYAEPLEPTLLLEHGQTVAVGDLKLEVIHTPGHSPGSIGLRLHEDSGARAAETVFSGDTLFHRGVGRTDLWGADQDLMFRSIRERLYSLDGDTRVCPGHGPDTRMGEERRENPFVRG